MSTTDYAKMIVAYLEEDRLSLEEQQEILKSALRIVEHQMNQEDLNNPNEQLKLELRS